MTRNVMAIITSYTELNTSVRRIRDLSDDKLTKKPKRMAKKIIGNMFPSAMALMMLSGTMAMIWSTKDILPTARSPAVTVSCKLRSTFFTRLEEIDKQKAQDTGYQGGRHVPGKRFARNASQVGRFANAGHTHDKSTEKPVG